MVRFLICLFLLASLGVQAQRPRLYNPAADAAKDVAGLLVRAKEENKNVLLQIGGNGCVMCYRFNAFVQTDTALKKLAEENYIIYHLNNSRENMNERYLKTIGAPHRSGLPVFAVLDTTGRLLHTQSGTGLQRGNGYDTDKVRTFFMQWAQQPPTF
jgi:thioredoxin-related protein